jgi:hypothetical protein
MGSLRIVKRGTPFPRCPLPSEQPCDDGYHRSQTRMQEASEAKTVRPTARLAGFEAEEHKHVSLLLVCTVTLVEPDIVQRPAIWEEFRLGSLGPSHSPLRLFVAREMVGEAYAGKEWKRKFWA